jgi:uncharacterized protein (TIGR02453 family)
VTTAEAPCFSPQLFAFLRELKQHNERAWFNANKDRYEREVEEPALAFVEDLGYRLPQVAPYLTADRRSLFRIYRDTRLSKDKPPYKTHVGIYFRHTRSAEADTPGLYLHLEPLGAGIWHPGTPALKRIRGALAARPEAWRAAVAEIEPEWRLGEGEPLKRPPGGLPRRPSADRRPQAQELHHRLTAHPTGDHRERLSRHVRGARGAGAAVHAVPVQGARRRATDADLLFRISFTCAA